MARIASIDVPQADRLEVVRQLVDAVGRGVTANDALANEVGLSDRHLSYYLQAARILGLLALRPSPMVLPLGTQLLQASSGSADESRVFAEAIRSNANLLNVCGDFLAEKTDRATLAAKLEAQSDLSAATANRRARTLYVWQVAISESLARVTAPAASLGSKDGTQASTPTTSTETSAAITSQTRLLIANQMARGKLVLLTGAGFSIGASNASGQRLPLGTQLARDLWGIAFPGSPFEDGSRLGEIYAVALNKNRPALQRYLTERLSVDSSRLPSYYSAWFSCPWRKIYTLNQDDLETAAALKFELPRQPRTVSAAPGTPAFDTTERKDQVRVIHLNGCVADGADRITFSPPQYGTRHATHDAAYAELATDFIAYSIILVGTELDESILWHHIELRDAKLSKAAREFRPRSFIVCPRLSLAKQGLLEQYKITWIAATAEQFASEVLSTLTAEAAEGLTNIRQEFDLTSDRPDNIRPVSDLVANPPRSRTEYLLGEHPQWSDILEDKAVERSSDQELRRQIATPRTTSNQGRVHLVTGTAGAGKSTTLMRAALGLSAAGESVGWVGTDTEVSARSIGEVAESGKFSVLAIDDLDRYGTFAPKLLRRICLSSSIKLVLASIRASKVEVTVDSPNLGEIELVEFAIPHLTDADIDAVLDVLHREHRLGELKQLTREEQVERFRKHAARQILVAMIEATSGQRFEEKVLREWSELPSQHQLAYTMIALAGSLGIAVSKSELLLAASGRSDTDISQALAQLAERRIVVFDTATNLYRPRHRLVAETLLDELAGSGRDITNAIESLAFAVSSAVSPATPPSGRGRRLLKILLNHEYLFRKTDIDGARRIYDASEENLTWDHHFWLQRGMLELHEGSTNFAEQCLSQARALEQDDPFVETAFAHLLFRKAVTNPGATDADEWVASAVQMLERQIEARGNHDWKLFHVLGSQAIAWFGKARWPVERRKYFLEGVRRTVRTGVSAFPRNAELFKLEKDIVQSLLSLAVR